MTRKELEAYKVNERLIERNMKKIEDEDVYPFSQAIQNGADAILVGHLLIPKVTGIYPASLSRKFICKYIRKKFRYNRLIITDDLKMRAIKLFYGPDLAVRKAFEAGNDIIVFRFNKDEEQRVLNNIVQLVESGKIKENRIDRSVNRIIEIKEKYDISDKQNFEGVNVDKINEKIIDIRKKQIKQLDELIKSQFSQRFENDKCPNYKWKEVFNTTTGKLDSNAMVEGGNYPFFTCAKESFWIDKYAFDCEALLLAGNNAAGIYDVKYYKGKFNAYQRTYVLTLKNHEWSYQLFKLQLEEKLELLRHQSKGTNTRYLTMTILNDLEFKIPSVEEQNKFAEFVKQIDKQKFEIQKSLEEIQKLQESLMNKYFG